MVKSLSIEAAVTKRSSVPLESANDRMIATKGHVIVVRANHLRREIAAEAWPARAAAIIAVGAAITEK